MVFLTTFGEENRVVSVGLCRGLLTLDGEKDGIDDDILRDGRYGGDLRIPNIDAIQEAVHLQLTLERLDLLFRSLIGCGFPLARQEGGKEEDKRNADNGGNQVGIGLGLADGFFHLSGHYGFHIGLASGVAGFVTILFAIGFSGSITGFISIFLTIGFTG